MKFICLSNFSDFILQPSVYIIYIYVYIMYTRYVSSLQLYTVVYNIDSFLK